MRLPIRLPICIPLPRPLHFMYHQSCALIIQCIEIADTIYIPVFITFAQVSYTCLLSPILLPAHQILMGPSTAPASVSISWELYSPVRGSAGTRQEAERASAHGAHRVTFLGAQIKSCLGTLTGPGRVCSKPVGVCSG